MKTPTRIAAKNSINNNMTFATVNWLLRWYWPEQLLFWAAFGHTASTTRAIMNVKTLLMWTTIINIFKAQIRHWHTTPSIWQGERNGPICSRTEGTADPRGLSGIQTDDDRQRIWRWGLWNRSTPRTLVARSKQWRTSIWDQVERILWTARPPEPRVKCYRSFVLPPIRERSDRTRTQNLLS